MNPTTPRERIVMAALRLFCERGYAAVGTADVCKAAGVLKGSLYHFFQSKLDVALAALAVYGDAVRAQFEAAARAGGTPADRLVRVFENVRQQAESDVQEGGVVYGCLHGNLAMELSSAEPRARAALEAVSASWADALTPLVGELLRQSGKPDADARRSARAALAYLHGVVLMAKTANQPALIADLGRDVVSLITSGTRPSP
ncbi:MAG: TetR/AcrR family transcriptional regulator [Gemmataceae bacterium]